MPVCLCAVRCGAAGSRYHLRDPREPPFNEGDVVGFGTWGLTRRTQGCKQLGIISRRAVVEGSLPTTGDGSGDDEHGHDTVAYCGRLPVKLRGGCAAHDYLVCGLFCSFLESLPPMCSLAGSDSTALLLASHSFRFERLMF